MTEPIMVDLRALVGGTTNPVLVSCPCHDDPAESLGVYPDHAFCYGRRRYFRRYEAAALLLGLWDGNPKTVQAAVASVRPILASGRFRGQEKSSAVSTPVPLDRSMPDTFHRYLIASPEDLAFFKQWRGLTDEVIDFLNLGFTGSHFTIPVYGKDGGLRGVRYRADPRVDLDGPKYSGIAGHNGRMLYSAPCFCDIEKSGVAWVVEGELDLAAGRVLGLPALTMTNGFDSLTQLPMLLSSAGVKPYRWIIATDADEAGDRAAAALHKILDPLSVRAAWDTSYKDLSALVAAGGTREDIRLTGQEKGGMLRA